jgi:hypothetical protein
VYQISSNHSVHHDGFGDSHAATDRQGNSRVTIVIYIQ